MKTLDAGVPQTVTYCIPLWLRDEQIKQAMARIKDRLVPHPAPRTDPVAVVGFGPSLNDTWEEVRKFPFIISCSGSHKFLLERGIVPTWHVEVDPREHKVELIGPPHPNVEYLISSTCHPKVFDHLSSFRVRLWHVFDATEDGVRLLPPGEWAITGGCDVGLRCLTIAGFLGFRDLHVFGLDGCAKNEKRHADAHPKGGNKFAPCEYEGKTYYTTPGMLEAARQVWHELDQMPTVKTTFYGEGLIQEMAKHYIPAPTKDVRKFEKVVAFSKQELISVEYRTLNERLHFQNLAYGVGGGKHAKIVQDLAKQIESTSVLDYGCGKGYLAKELPFPIWEYDPAVEGKTESPRPADLVVCTDVLEHVEPEKIGFVLADLRRVTRKLGFFVIHTGPSGKTLEDGRNAHILQRNAKWWIKMLGKFFQLGKVWIKGPLVYVLVVPGKQEGKVKTSAVKEIA